MKIIKKFILLIMFILLFKNASANPLTTIQNCADEKILNEKLMSLNEWEVINSYDAILKEHTNRLKKHKSIIAIIEEELNYLSKINFVQFQDEFRKFSLEIPFLVVLFGKYFDTFQWNDYNENLMQEKRILSDYFIDYNKTKSSLQTMLKTHQFLKVEVVNKINELKKIGKIEYNLSSNKKFKKKNQKLKNMIEKNLDDKMLNKNYNLQFFTCEKERVKSPISFDYKWK